MNTKTSWFRQLPLFSGIALAAYYGSSLGRSAGADPIAVPGLFIGTLLCAVSPISNLRRQLAELHARINDLKMSR